MDRKAWKKIGSNHFYREYILPRHLRRTGDRENRLQWDFDRDFSYQPLVRDKVLTIEMNIGELGVRVKEMKNRWRK